MRDVSNDVGTPALFDGPARPARPIAAADPCERGFGLTLGTCATRGAVIEPVVGPATLEVFERAVDPGDPFELRDLYIGRVEAALGAGALRPQLAERWRESRHRRCSITADDVLQMPSTFRFVKELFNFFFRDDLYGALRCDDTTILSSGSANELAYGLPQVLKDCVTYAMDRDWYGYSDSRGRPPTRDAIARLENARIPGASYDVDCVSVTMGGTFAMNAVADFVFHFLHRPASAASPALCLAPNYPPLVEAVSRRAPTRLVLGESGQGRTSLGPLIEALTPDTPLVMLQTVTNPTGCRVDEADIDALIAAASPTTIVVLDEAHECTGPAFARSPRRAAPNVIRMVSLSKSLAVPGLKVGWLMTSPEVGREYYEYASTSYGGPPSVFALLIEVAARFERWLLEGIDAPGPAELGEVDADARYALTLGALQRAYDQYTDERARHEREVVGSRRWTIDALAAADAGLAPVVADYSVNVALAVNGTADSYEWFRRTIATSGVSVYPGVLNLLFDEPCVRVTSAAAPDVLREGVARLTAAGALERDRERGPTR